MTSFKPAHRRRQPRILLWIASVAVAAGVLHGFAVSRFSAQPAPVTAGDAHQMSSQHRVLETDAGNKPDAVKQGISTDSHSPEHDSVHTAEDVSAVGDYLDALANGHRGDQAWANLMLADCGNCLGDILQRWQLGQLPASAALNLLKTVPLTDTESLLPLIEPLLLSDASPVDRLQFARRLLRSGQTELLEPVLATVATLEAHTPGSGRSYLALIAEGVSRPQTARAVFDTLAGRSDIQLSESVEIALVDAVNAHASGRVDGGSQAQLLADYMETGDSGVRESLWPLLKNNPRALMLTALKADAQGEGELSARCGSALAQLSPGDWVTTAMQVVDDDSNNLQWLSTRLSGDLRTEKREQWVEPLADYLFAPDSSDNMRLLAARGLLAVRDEPRVMELLQAAAEIAQLNNNDAGLYALVSAGL